MSAYFPDLFRAFITDIMLILLLSTMATPKYKNKWIYIFTTAALILLNCSVNYYFYLQKNYTAVFLIDFVMLIVIGVALKPLFSDKIMQWCFSYVTMINIYAAILFLSYILCDFFPKPIYANTYLRLALFSLIIFMFRKWVSEVYRNVLDYWHIYLFPIVSLLVCFLSYLFGGNIEEKLLNHYSPLILLVILMFSVYIAIIHSLKTITKQYKMREENQAMQTEREYLHLAADNMTQRLKLMEEVTMQNSRAAHDRRHFNNMLLELLEQGENSEAITLLKKQTRISPKISKIYCENTPINAAVCHYATLAEQLGIKTDIELDLSNNITLDSLELAMVVSNLMENAIQACGKFEHKNLCYLRFTCRNVGRLLLEMENPCTEDTKLDENGYPIAQEKDHGIGSKSVLAFSKKYDGELLYKIENGVFRVRLLV